MDYKEKIENLKKSCYGNAPCEIDKERLEAAQIIEKLDKERDEAVTTLETIMCIQKLCVFCGNIECKNSNTHDETCNPKWNGIG